MLGILFKNIYNFFPIIILSIIIILKYILKFDVNKILTIVVYLLSLYFLFPFYFLLLFTKNNVIVNYNLDFSIITTILFIILPLSILLFTILLFLLDKKDLFKFIIILPFIYLFTLIIIYYI